jgi:SAM-dependent methyltransferase/uncharacterized membrane protein YbhN (UPF0104 family)
MPRLLRINVLLIAAGALIAGVWIYATGSLEAFAAAWPRPVHVALLLGCTAFCVLVRFVRWQFLLRRADVRLPARGSLFVYSASLVGMATPAYVGELIRSVLLKRRFGSPLRITISVLVFERLFDVAALGLIGAACATGGWARVGLGAAVGAALVATLVFRRGALLLGVPPSAVERLFTPGVWVPGLILSLLAWVPAAGLVSAAARAVNVSVPLVAGMGVFSASTLIGGMTLMPAGVGVTGSVAILQLHDLGLSIEEAIRLVSVLRLGTVGAALVVGMACLLVIGRSLKPAASTAAVHFDDIGAEYGEQFRPHVWEHLLRRKTGLIRRVLEGQVAPDAIGLDLGCGLGDQSLALRAHGLRVMGMEPAWSLARRARTAGVPVVAGTALALPFGDSTVAFVYAVGMLHHLPDPEAQRAAVAEALRVLVPGGFLLVHETNPRNLVFRFYMGYVFPILKSIDEGTECWLAPEGWRHADGFRLTDVQYFTFFPDFVPRALLPPSMALSAWLEASPLARYSAHYLAVLRKETSAVPARGPRRREAVIETV